MLPEEFLSRMKAELGGDFPAFLAEYDKPAVRTSCSGFSLTAWGRWTGAGRAFIMIYGPGGIYAVGRG